MSELVIFSICGGGKIGLTGEEEGDATEEINLRGRKRCLIPLLWSSSIMMGLLRFRCERCNSLRIMASKYIIGWGAKRPVAGADRGEVLGLVYLCGANWFKL